MDYIKLISFDCGIKNLGISTFFYNKEYMCLDSFYNYELCDNNKDVVL